MNHYIKTKSVLVRKKTISNLLDFLKTCWVKIACKLSSSNNTSKKVIFVILVELQLSYVNFEMESDSLPKLYRPLKLCCVLYQKRTRTVPVSSVHLSLSLFIHIPYLLVWKNCKGSCCLEPKDIHPTLLVHLCDGLLAQWW